MIEHARQLPEVTHRAIWISDTHLGTPEARAGDLVRFLDRHEPETLYLVGDIIDVDRLSIRPHWPTSHALAVQRILDLAARGRRVVYLPGNHDAALRHALHLEVSGVEILPSVVHTLADGRRLLVMHGDTLDQAASRGRLGKAACYAVHGLVQRGVRRVNARRTRSGLPRLRAATWFRRKVPAVRRYVERYERALVRAAGAQRVDGIVCGHIHCPALRMDGPGIYANCGDWLDHASAVVESLDGRLDLVHAPEAPADPAAAVEIPAALARLRDLGCLAMAGGGRGRPVCAGTTST